MRPRLTYANVVATLALFVALGGSAVAARSYVITSSKQIAPKVRAELKGRTGPAGPQGPIGLTGPAGAAGPKGDTGVAGAAGTAVAYGLVAADGTLDPTIRKGVGSVTKPGTGSYCIFPASGVSFAGKRAVATLDFAAANNAVISTRDPSGPCDGGVRIFTGQLTSVGGSGAVSVTDQPFFFVVP